MQINNICHLVIDYIYMCTNNAIISNIQSKDLIAVRCLHVTSNLLPFTCHFHYLDYSPRSVVSFVVIIHIPHNTNNELTYIRHVTVHCPLTSNLKYSYIFQLFLITDILEGYSASG